MNPLLGLAIVLGALGFAFIVFVLIPRALLLGMRQALEARIKRRYPGEGLVAFVEFSASSFGVRAIDLGQWRGNGALVLSETELCFFEVTPERELSLQLSRITGLSVLHSHLGKATPSQLLRVEFDGKNGPGAIAYWVPDPPALLALIEARRA